MNIKIDLLKKNKSRKMKTAHLKILNSLKSQFFYMSHPSVNLRFHDLKLLFCIKDINIFQSMYCVHVQLQVISIPY